MADFVKVASTNDLPPGDLMLVDLDGDRVVLANAGGQIYALSELCTHAECPLSEAIWTVRSWCAPATAADSM